MRFKEGNANFGGGWKVASELQLESSGSLSAPLYVFFRRAIHTLDVAQHARYRRRGTGP